jgi:hypothetical protein
MCSLPLTPAMFYATKNLSPTRTKTTNEILLGPNEPMATSVANRELSITTRHITIEPNAGDHMGAGLTSTCARLMTPGP